MKVWLHILFVEAVTSLLLLWQVGACGATSQYFSQGIYARAFSRDEFRAVYELMVQYKHGGSAPSCPEVIEYNGIPVESDMSLQLSHVDMAIAEKSTDAVEPCTDDGVLHLVRSDHLRGENLKQFEQSISGDEDKTTTLGELITRLAGKVFYVSAHDSERQCGKKWFHSNESFLFFDESDDVEVTVVAKMKNSQPVLLSLPLVGNIRYMVVVRAGSTCIYRVEVDVDNLLNNIARPSDSPSIVPTVTSSFSNIIASQSVSPATSIVSWTQTSPSPDLSEIISPSQTNFPSPSTSAPPLLFPTSIQLASMSPGSAIAQTLLPTPTTGSVSPYMSLNIWPSVSHSTSTEQAVSPSKIPLLAHPTPTSSGEFDVGLHVSPGASMEMTEPAPSDDGSLQTTPYLLVSPKFSSSIHPSQLASSPQYTEFPSGTVDPSNPNNQIGAGDRNVTVVDGVSTCFPSTSLVTLSSGETIPMSTLKIGDKVLAENGIHTDVIMFTHSDASKSTWFIAMMTEGGKMLKVTPGHVLPVNGILVEAREIQLGDQLTVVTKDEIGWKETKELVVDIGFVLDTGLYNPQTSSGMIVVDGILASCYTEALVPAAAHALLAPVRGLVRAVHHVRIWWGMRSLE